VRTVFCSEGYHDQHTPEKVILVFYFKSCLEFLLVRARSRITLISRNQHELTNQFLSRYSSILDVKQPFSGSGLLLHLLEMRAKRLMQ
jgi:hypothetical protein